MKQALNLPRLTVLLAALAGLFALPPIALAQDGSGDDTLTTTIDAANSKPNDAAIADRISGIFSVIDGLGSLEIDVTSGVVTLSGNVVDEANIDRAVSIASRVAGVVTVENEIARDLSLDENLEPVVDKVIADIDGLTSALPLFGLAALVAIGIGAFGHLVASVRPLWRWIAPNAFLADLIATTIRVLFIGFGIFAALDILNATALIGAILGSVGVIGLAVGFAVRDTVDNYISSIMLSIRQPFRANDYVKIGDREGHVVRLTSRATILMTLQGNHLRIPNATVFKSEIINFSTNPERRFAFELGVDADDDPAAAIETGLEAVNALPFVLKSPKATGSIKEVGDSNIILTFKGWINQRDTDYLKARGAAIRNSKMALEDAGFALPEPIYRLRFDAAATQALATVQEQQSGDQADAPKPVPKKRPKAADKDVDVSVDTHVENMVKEERAEGGQEDLLNDDQQQE